MTESPLTRLVRALLLATAAVVLVGLVAVAAGGYRLGRSGSSQATPYAVDTILTIVVTAYGIAAVVLLGGAFWAGLEARRHPQRARRQRGVPSVFVTLGLIAVLFLAADRFHWRFDPNRFDNASPAKVPTSRAPLDQRRRQAPRDPDFQWAAFAAVLGAAAVAFAALFAAERRRKRRLPPEPLVADELVDVLDETLADLRAERDPRRAVIGAYARMERVLAAHGVPRRRFEAPHEYLGRVLTELTGGGRAAERLTALFERARFSTHTVDATMKAEAIAAVQDLQAELAAIEAAEAAAAA